MEAATTIRTLVLVEVAAVVGFVSFGPCRDETAPSGRGEVWAIYVAHPAPGPRAQGFRSVSLWVIDGNERAKRFYCAAGFSVEVGSEKEFEIGGARLREVRMVVNNDS